MNKKGQISFNGVLYVTRFIFLIVVIISFILLIRHFVVQNLNVQTIQSEVFANRVLYSQDGILYHDDELNRDVPGMIDNKKLTNDTLNNMMNYTDKSFIAAEINLFDINNNKLVTARYNEKTYANWVPIAKTKLEGAGGIKLIKKTQLVNYISEDKIYLGILEFTVLLPGN
jgi:hypothetical protein